ncbi:hypothetical protein [Bordetella avium]|uniref:Lipoprotein n=1 Tax=Bordetella avium (strain 197N) TaxID=360910 RepID=Q2L033_BORA1|nr:hypothetical protein [Bordetella avium]AZY47945.1 hypothetical protein C0J09_01420 [Bordetella avium]RIQ14829.1 hypothetical protein D0432_01500 [Bordetella avium]RIQ18680.1 hypothetical protein D0850_06340 [Bordetella avium]RIQ45920.1 hypothetical protein D0847_01445 [Bordetella avium]RIQ53684.1 hypothetical protein D0843_05465 [Bordetella avium]
MRLLWLISCLILLAGCGWIGSSGERLSWKGAVITASSDMNDNSALAVDLVVARDAMLGGQLAALSAEQWFERRADLRAAYGAQLDVVSWELVPGQQWTVGAQGLPAGRTMGVYLFARYGGSGAHRTRITQLNGTLRLYLGARNVRVLLAP